MSSATPSVLLVLVDEWRAQSFGYAGDADARTPNVDAFAAESVNFAQAISGTPVCSPARASMLTGQYPLTHGVYINDVPLRRTGTTLAEVFQTAGYDTGYIGKWHLYGSPGGWFERREAYIPPTDRFGFDYWKVLECTHDYNRSPFYAGDDPTKRFWDGYDAIAQTRDAVEYIRSRASRPYFLTVSYGPPHFPLDSAPAAAQAMYESHTPGVRPNVPGQRRAQAEADLRGYYAHMATIDECFGDLLRAVDDDTIVVFTSDHGDMMWSQGLEYKLTPWEESIRVPLLVRHRGRQAPRRSQALVNSPDLMPTILGFASLPIPDSVQGADLSTSAGPATALLSVPVGFSTMRWNGFAEYRGVRDTRYTYVRSRYGPWLLYDNVTDPFQMRNRCGDPTLAEVEQRLESALRQWLDRIGDDFLPGEDYLERDGLTHYFEVNEPVGYTRSPWQDWTSTVPRGRHWSIDTPLELLVGDPRPRRILEDICPVLLTPSVLERLGRDSPRVATMLHPTLTTPAHMVELDEALMRLEPRDADPVDQVATGRGSASHNRLPDAFQPAA